MIIEMLNIIEKIEHTVSNFLQANQALPLPLAVILAFSGGLASSLTPCVLPMVPLYLSYIGATETRSKIDVLKKTSLFCLGSAMIFSLMGIFASFASFVMIEYRGYVHIAIGLFILLMSVFLLDIIKLPLPQIIKNIPEGSPFIVGLAFALISSPCASPILFAILAMASASGSFFSSTLIMTAYSFGYTGIIFLTGIFAGLLKQLDFFKKHSRVVSVASSAILAVLGVFYLYSGISWFF